MVLFRALDEREEPTGRIAGLEIVGFLDFDRWDALSALDLRWRLPGWQPTPIDDLLRRLQARLRAQIRSAALA